MSYNVPVIMLSGFAAEYNPHYAPFSFFLTNLKKGGSYGKISSSSFMARSVSYGSSSLVPSPFAALLMFCTNPGYHSGLGFIPCGKCQSCKIAKKKEWSDRLIIESKYHPFNYFVTLTYDPEHYPDNESLDPYVLKCFLKRLGYYCGKVPQYFACGEYGDEDYTERAHYHVAIFSDKDIFNEILASWNNGNVDIKPLLPERCKYICGYVVKKMTKKDDERLDGRHPEFFSNSRRPALGYGLLFDLLKRFATDEHFRQVMLSHAYPPYHIMVAGRQISLPRYIRDKLRHLYDENKDLQQIKKDEKSLKDSRVHEAIRQTLQRVYGIEIGTKEGNAAYRELCKSREKLYKKAYERKHRSKL